MFSLVDSISVHCVLNTTTQRVLFDLAYGLLGRNFTRLNWVNLDLLHNCGFLLEWRFFAIRRAVHYWKHLFHNLFWLVICRRSIHLGLNRTAVKVLKPPVALAEARLPWFSRAIHDSRHILFGLVQSFKLSLKCNDNLVHQILLVLFHFFD